MDEVDEVMAAWHRECPDFITSSMEAWSWVHRLTALLNGERKCCFTGYGLEVWGFGILVVLRYVRRSYRLSSSQLLQQAHVTSGTMTNQVDRFCVHGSATRYSDPSDSRAALVKPTTAGRRAVNETPGVLVELEESLLAGWPETEHQALAGMLRRLPTVAQNRNDSRHCLFRIACHSYRYPLNEKDIGASTTDPKRPPR